MDSEVLSISKKNAQILEDFTSKTIDSASYVKQTTEALVNLSKRSSLTDGHRDYNFSPSPTTTFSQSLHGAINGQDYPQTPNSRLMAYPTAHQAIYSNSNPSSSGLYARNYCEQMKNQKNDEDNFQ